MKVELSNLDGSEYEFTIIGSGPAGITAALKLEAKGKKVLLLEAGSSHYTTQSQELYNGTIVGPYPSLIDTRVRCFGGTSNVWAGWCRPLDKGDFEKFPIEKEDLDHYLEEASNILEIKGIFNSDITINNIGYIFVADFCRFRLHIPEKTQYKCIYIHQVLHKH